jgi:vacuolar protein sorting-associated protein 13A/C
MFGCRFPDHRLKLFFFQCVLWDVTWELQKGSFSLKNHSKRSTDLLSIVFEGLTASFVKYPISSAGTLQLGAMTVTDGSTPNSFYPTLIQALPSAIGASRYKPLSKNLFKWLLTISSSEAFFKLKFEHLPLDDRADSALSISMLPLQVIVNTKAISSVLDFFSKPAADLATMSTLKVHK